MNYTNNQIKKKKPILLKIHASGMGDALTATPALRKLHEFYDSKIIVKSRYPNVFKKNPYIVHHFHLDELLDEYEYEVFTCFASPNRKHHACSSIRSCAYDMGFDLLNHELSYDYIADDKCIYDFNYLKKYICLQTTSNWENRTWKPEYWQKLVDLLHDTDLNIVIIGKDYQEIYFDDSICHKKCFVPKGKKVIDFTNDGSSLSDLWHLINNARGIVTVDSGPLHVAGTTDTWIFQIGTARHPEFVTPFRNGSQNYKHEFIGGECKLFCASNIKYSVKEWSSINSVHFLPKCQENYTEMKCHPFPEQIFNSIKSKLNI